MEYRAWYQYYFLAERGRKGLEKNRREFCRLLWRLWSPNWHFDDETYERSAKSFDNPDFVIFSQKNANTARFHWRDTICPRRLRASLPRRFSLSTERLAVSDHPVVASPRSPSLNIRQSLMRWRFFKTVKYHLIQILSEASL